MLQVEAVGVVVQLWQVHAVQAEAHRPGEELLGVHHVRCEKTQMKRWRRSWCNILCWPCVALLKENSASGSGEKRGGRSTEGGDKIKTGNHGTMHRRADMLMCKQACTQKTQHMRCKHARNCPEVCVCNLLSGGGGHCDTKGASSRRLPPPLSTESWRQSDCLRFCFRENQYFPAVRRLVYFQSLGDTLIIYKGNQVSLRPPKFTLANIYALVIWQSFNYPHQGGCFFLVQEICFF